MKLSIGPKDVLMIDDAKICWKNFAGDPTPYDRNGGKREFHLVIPNDAIKDALLNNKSRDGASWNVKIRAPREEGEAPFLHMKVNVRFNDFGPKVYLVTGGRQHRLDEEDVGMLDKMDIESVDMDIRPNDSIVNGVAYRTAYLRSIRVYQRSDRFEADMCESEWPEE